VRPTNMHRTRTAAAAISMLAATLAGCGSTNVTSAPATIEPSTSPPTVEAGGRATAVWRVESKQALDEGSTRFTALVTRLGCNGGVTGTVNSPDVQITPDRIVITFTVSPGPPKGATCPGNGAVPAVVELPEPLGARALVDGACETTEAETTSFCIDGGVRQIA
jgi:hypothetical protein